MMSRKSSRLAAVRAVYLLCLVLSAVFGFRSFDPDQVGSGLVSLMKSEVSLHASGTEQSDDLTMLCLKIKN